MKIRKTAAVLAIASALMFSLPAFAAEDTAAAAAESGTQEESYEVLIQSDLPKESDPALQQSIEEENELIAYLNGALQELSGMTVDQVSEDQIVELRDLYESLSMAAKTRVENYEVLKSFIETFRIGEIPEEKETSPSEDEGPMLTTAYGINPGRQPLSVTVHYVTDQDGDKQADKTAIRLVSPEGEEIAIEPGTSVIKNETVAVSIDWQDKYVQLNFTTASPGLWLVSSDAYAVMEAIDYAGEQESGFETETGEDISAEESSESKADDGDEKKPSLAGSIIKVVLGLLALISIPIAYVIVKKVVLNRKTGKKPARKKKKDEDDEDDEFLDWDEKERMQKEREEAEMKAMANFLKHQQVGTNYDESDEEAATDDDISIREELEKQSEEDAKYEEITEYPSGMIDDGEENEDPFDDDDDDFGNRM